MKSKPLSSWPGRLKQRPATLNSRSRTQNGTTRHSTRSVFGCRRPSSAARQKARALIDDAKRQLATGRRAQTRPRSTRRGQVSAAGVWHCWRGRSRRRVRSFEKPIPSRCRTRSRRASNCSPGSKGRWLASTRSSARDLRKCGAMSVRSVDKLRVRIRGARRRFDQARKSDDFPVVQQAVAAASAARQQLDAIARDVRVC